MDAELFSYGLNGLLGVGSMSLGFLVVKYKPQLEGALNSLGIALNALNQIRTLGQNVNKASSDGVISQEEQKAIINEIIGIVNDPEIKYLMNKYKV